MLAKLFVTASVLLSSQAALATDPAVMLEKYVESERAHRKSAKVLEVKPIIRLSANSLEGNDGNSHWWTSANNVVQVAADGTGGDGHITLRVNGGQIEVRIGLFDNWQAVFQCYGHMTPTMQIWGPIYIASRLLSRPLR